MSYTNVLLSWMEHYGDPSSLSEWIPTEQFQSEGSHALTDVAHRAVDKFVTLHARHVPTVISAHPEFREWYGGRGGEIIRDLARIRVRTELELVDVIGLLRHLKGYLDEAESPKDLWFWLVETLVDLRAGLESLHVLNEPETLQWTFTPVQAAFTLGPSMGPQMIFRPAGEAPAGSASLACEGKGLFTRAA